MPQSVSPVDLAQRGVIPRKQFYIKLFVFNTVILGFWILNRWRRKPVPAGLPSSSPDIPELPDFDDEE